MQTSINPKTIGKTVVVKLGTKTFKANLEKDQKDKLKQYVAKYNAKPSEFWLKKITKLFEVKEKVSEAKVANKKLKKLKKEKKGLTKVVKKETAANKKIIEVVDSTLSHAKKVEAIKEASVATAPRVYQTPTKRFGEY